MSSRAVKYPPPIGNFFTRWLTSMIVLLFILFQVLCCCYMFLYCRVLISTWPQPDVTACYGSGSSFWTYSLTPHPFMISGYPGCKAIILNNVRIGLVIKYCHQLKTGTAEK